MLPREIWQIVAQYAQHWPFRQVCKRFYTLFPLTSEQVDRLGLFLILNRPKTIKYLPIERKVDISQIAYRNQDTLEKFSTYIYCQGWKIQINRTHGSWCHYKSLTFTINTKSFTITVPPVGNTYLGSLNEKIWAGCFFYRGNIIDLVGQKLYKPPNLKFLNFGNGAITAQHNKRWVKIDINPYLERFH